MTKYKILSSFHLKLIAMTTMLIDHIGAVLLRDQMILRYIGRISFPIYCFLLVEGYVYSKNIKAYLFRLGIFAVISEIPFDLAFYHQIFNWQHQNVFLTLFIGLLSLYIFDFFKKKDNFIFKLIGLASVGICAVAAEYLRTDYGLFGVISIFIFYLLRHEALLRAIAITFLNGMMSTIQLYAAGCFIPITLYNGKKGYNGNILKLAFYIFYPLHLLILFYVSTLS